MPVFIERPAVTEAAGPVPTFIEEFVGRRARGGDVSIARMTSPEGWAQAGQRLQRREIVLVLRGLLRVEHASGTIDVRSGQAMIAAAGEWVRYSAPEPGGAEHIVVIPRASGGPE